MLHSLDANINERMFSRSRSQNKFAAHKVTVVYSTNIFQRAVGSYSERVT